MPLSYSNPNEQLKRSVWVKGQIIPGYDASVYRRDDYGLAMRFSDYGDRNSNYGWEIDHITPVASGGGDHLGNLRPLHWRTNVSR